MLFACVCCVLAYLTFGIHAYPERIEFTVLLEHFLGEGKSSIQQCIEVGACHSSPPTIAIAKSPAPVAPNLHKFPGGGSGAAYCRQQAPRRRGAGRCNLMPSTYHTLPR